MTILLRKVVVGVASNNPRASYARSLSGLQLWSEDISSDIKLRIEDHWRGKIAETSSDDGAAGKQKYYVLSMFPYPSGSLHMGHIRVYAISDTVARFQRMNGKNVIHPIGWDAFGLPAENAAMERETDPSEWTLDNIARMKSQLKRLGCSFDWEREIATCDPSYYRWTQDLFLKLYDADLVYRKEALVNWDPVDGTVLADEQVDENGNSWRSGVKVEKKLLRQWFVRTTRFAKALYDGLADPTLEDWRDIKKLQRHWIGECAGVNFDFFVDGVDSDRVTVWTDKPEYIKHVKFVVVAGSHALARKEGATGVGKLKTCLKNPFGDESVPVFVTDELKFAPPIDSFLGIPGACEIAARFADTRGVSYEPLAAVEDAHNLERTRDEVCSEARKWGFGGYWSSAKLRDWLISRQRYWGTPIPIVHCASCGTVAVPREHLPVRLPKLTALTQKGKSPLAEVSDWVNTKCPQCGGAAARETDTMDTFVDSAWYFLRYLDPGNTSEMFGRHKVFEGMPVDLYIGGKEHAVLHLYYARFVGHFLHSLGLVPTAEPFKRLLVQGMVMGRSFRVKGTGRYLAEDQVDVIDSKRNKAVAKATGEAVAVTWEKMSKSKRNGVDPDAMFARYGVDTTRLLMLADVAPTSHRHWTADTFPGVLGWQHRLWLTVREFLKTRGGAPPPPLSEEEFERHEADLRDARNYYVRGATFNYAISQQLSVAVSKQQGLTTRLRRAPAAVFARGAEFERALAAQIVMLAPMAPHFASELWSGFVAAPGRLATSGIAWDEPVLCQRWPEVDADYELELSCQVNGHEYCSVKMPRVRLEALTTDEAYDEAVGRMRDVPDPRAITGVEFRRHRSCDAILNVFLDRSRL
ncbi:probable leucine--tRNA ligase, mitochondrial [Cylas formicarius]|uniref:probable leucine--tRNA ligase, mitochondrial n=1 Tax=Cylas formicarius TaxID=197179 RepID=UPI00295878B5|nr:probable leucine--tRNA ligase, mitochondrial [Cylas formicarius]